MPKCSFKNCKKKLSAVDVLIVCRCEKSFCSKHRPAEEHNCNFDYKKLYKIDEKIEKTHGSYEKI